MPANPDDDHTSEVESGATDDRSVAVEDVSGRDDGAGRDDRDARAARTARLGDGDGDGDANGNGNGEGATGRRDGAAGTGRSAGPGVVPPLDAPEAPRSPRYVRSRWPLVAARAAVTVVFGVLALVSPGITLSGLMVAFGVFAVVAGVLLLVDAVRVGGPQRPLLAVQGVLDATAGLVALVWPSPSLAVVVALLGAWAVASGLVEVVVGVAGRAGVPSAYVPVLAGGAWVLLGVLLFGRQDLELPAVAVLVGAFALGEGAMVLASAMRLRQLPRP